jgi:hypothetical protein
MGTGQQSPCKPYGCHDMPCVTCLRMNSAWVAGYFEATEIKTRVRLYLISTLPPTRERESLCSVFARWADEGREDRSTRGITQLHWDSSFLHGTVAKVKFVAKNHSHYYTICKRSQNGLIATTLLNNIRKFAM